MQVIEYKGKKYYYFYTLSTQVSKTNCFVALFLQSFLKYGKLKKEKKKQIIDQRVFFRINNLTNRPRFLSLKFFLKFFSKFKVPPQNNFINMFFVKKKCINKIIKIIII